MEIKRNIGDKLTFEGTIYEIRVNSEGKISYNVVIETKDFSSRNEQRLQSTKKYLWIDEEEL